MLGCNILKMCYRRARFGNGETIGAWDTVGNMRIKCIWNGLRALCEAGCANDKRQDAAGDGVTHHVRALI
jgi:hypothetical protein